MTSRKTLINNLTEGPLSKQIILFSLPLILGNLLHTLYNLVDMAVVGQFVGSVGLSAVATSGQVTMLMYCLGIGLGTGGQILIAQQVGAGDREGVRKTIGTSFSFTIILSIIITALGLILYKTLLRALNTPAEAWTDAVEYLFWCCLGVPFTYLNGGLSALLRGMGDSKHPTWFVAAAAVSNIILDLIFVAGLGMRAKGAAIATAIAQCIGAAACIVYLYIHREELGFDFRWESFRMDRKILGTMLRLAAPLAFQSVSISISMIFVNSWVNVYGVTVSAVNGVGNKLHSLATMVTNAMQSTVATFTGQNIAARKQDRVIKTLRTTNRFALIFWLCIAMIGLLVPKLVFDLFTTEPEVLDMAPGYMIIQVVMYLSFALMCTPLGFITGIGYVSLNLIIAITDGVIARIGLSLLFAKLIPGPEAYWWASALAGFISVGWGWLYFFSGRWKKRKLLTD